MIGRCGLGAGLGVACGPMGTLTCELCVGSGDGALSEAERDVPPGPARAHGRLPAHEDAQAHPGPPVLRLLCHLRPHRPADLHGKNAPLSCSIWVSRYGFVLCFFG